MKTAINIYVDENEFDFARSDRPKSSFFELNSETSVSQLKAHYFETLGELGNIIRFKRDEATVGSGLARALSTADTFFATFHESPLELPCRLLQHTKGGLMLPGGFLDKWTFNHPSTVSLVTSKLQASRITRAFPTLPLHIFPFYPKIASEFLKIATAGHCVETDQRMQNHILYAGRWIANKGLVQTARTLRLWRDSASSFESIGQFEPDFPISQSGGGHFNYPMFHQREFLNCNSQVKLIQTSSQPPSALALSYQKAGAFAYLSFHEDENYGLAPREAAACDAIPIVTDWCGLGEFGRNAIGGLVRTWPTLGGIRYSLKEAAAEITRILSWTSTQRKYASAFNRKLVALECSGSDSVQQISDAVATLLDLPVAPPPDGGWRCPARLDQLIAHGPASFRTARSGISAFDRDGISVEGLGFGCPDHSEVDLLTAIQALYTTWPTTPALKPDVRLHGFWRVAIWEQERALVEFGFPGPRILRFSKTEWNTVVASAVRVGTGDFSFVVRDAIAVEVFNRTVELGYLVPDDPTKCILPEILNPVPQHKQV